MKKDKTANFSDWSDTTDFVEKLQLDEKATDISFKWVINEYVVRWNIKKD